MKNLSIGQVITVNIPESERAGNPVAKYHGKTMEIANRRSFIHGTNEYYELAGAESKHGIAYGFAREWLVGEE